MPQPHTEACTHACGRTAPTYRYAVPTWLIEVPTNPAQAKGHVARIALCLVDPERPIRDHAVCLFNALASKTTAASARGGRGGVIYAHLPEVGEALGWRPAPPHCSSHCLQAHDPCDPWPGALAGAAAAAPCQASHALACGACVALVMHLSHCHDSARPECNPHVAAAAAAGGRDARGSRWAASA